ncbi:hypothetical protein ACSBPH_13690 [Microbacterium sp. F51-2R]|uniref:hypothetical protein n=1 Tax=Microbacterium sp. F51-2R TaxID=3445777 RepID=UPI003F9F5761
MTDSDGIGEGARTSPKPASRTKRRRIRKLGLVAGALIVALAVGVVAFITRADSDQDGLADLVELSGWTTLDGGTYVTNPYAADTDADGLTDAEEAGPVSEPGVATVYTGVSNPIKSDSDDDDLGDLLEVSGWLTVQGAVHRTDPMNSDTDGDGLTDAQEAGPAKQSADGRVEFAAISDPGIVDTDGDGLSDAVEADLSLDALSKDTDDDQLDDYREVEILGTDPANADTDGDNFSDGFEVANAESRGLDPLWKDEQLDPTTIAWEVAQGAIIGELAPGDTLPWLLGNVASSGASLVPVVGTAIGTVADVRDAVGSAIHADWVGAGLSASSLVPYVGDTAAVAGKVAKFVDRVPTLAVAAGAAVVALKWIPGDVKATVVRFVNKKADDLTAAGVSDKALIALQMGKNSLDDLADAMKRPGHVSYEGVNAGFMATGNDGEEFLANLLGASTTGVDLQVVRPTADCVEVCNSVARRFDALVDGIGHESKVGRVSLTDAIRRQVESDAFSIKTGTIEGAHWHFFASDVTKKIGPTKPLLDLLDENGIKYTIHLPTEGK